MENSQTLKKISFLISINDKAAKTYRK